MNTLPRPRPVVLLFLPYVLSAREEDPQCIFPLRIRRHLRLLLPHLLTLDTQGAYYSFFARFKAVQLREAANKGQKVEAAENINMN